MDNWLTVLAWSAPIILVDELLKAIGRRLDKGNPLSQLAPAAVNVPNSFLKDR